MKQLTVLSALLLAAIMSFGEKIAKFPDIYVPMQIRIHDNKLYISEKAWVYIYSLDKFELLKKFGGEGEGPQEFKRYAFLYPTTDHLLINSVGKISYFKKDGTYIKEVRAKGEVANFAPLGKYFVARGFRVARYKKEKISYKTINLYDSNLTKLREIFKHELDWQQGKGTKLFHLAFSYQTHGDRIYIAGSKEFAVDVFNTDGKHLFTISQEYKRVKFTGDHKKQILDYFKRTRPDNYLYWEKYSIFPDYFPAIKRIYIRDHLLYIMTYRIRDNRYEFLIFDLEGKLLEKTFIPVADRRLMTPYPIEIHQKKLYQLLDNNETEKIELHCYTIGSSPKEKQ
jgi:hypothetical protein